MRDIKFRAWHKKEKKMFPVIVIDFLGKTDYLDGEPCVLLKRTLSRTIISQFDEVVIMQYTGLKDKNGKEIYEGDIVEVNNTYKMRSVVKQERGCWVIYLPTSYVLETSSSYDLRTFPLWQFEVEVIGNIYENPELMSEKEMKE